MLGTTASSNYVRFPVPYYCSREDCRYQLEAVALKTHAMAYIAEAYGNAVVCGDQRINRIGCPNCHRLYRWDMQESAYVFRRGLILEDFALDVRLPRVTPPGIR